MYLTAAACKEQPILATTYLEGLDFEMTEVLEDYKLLTYDILGGKKFWYNKELILWEKRRSWRLDCFGAEDFCNLFGSLW